MLNAWLKFVNKSQSEISEDSFICSVHFPSHCISSKGELYETVVPTLIPLKDGFKLNVSYIYLQIFAEKGFFILFFRRQLFIFQRKEALR